MTTNTTSSSPLVLYLAVVQKQVTRSLVILLVFGLLGNSASCAVFRQKQLRLNAVSLLLTAASICNIIVLIYGISYNLYTVDHVGADTYSIIFCKVRLYIRHILLMTVRSYVILACVACFALSSSRTSLRSLCRPRYIKLVIIAVPFVWPLIALHMPFLTILQKNRCINVDPYVLPFGIYFFLIVGVFPIILMVLFTLLTVNNLRLMRHRIQPSIATPMRLKSRDRQFIRMLSALVVMYVATNLFYPTNVLYSAITYWSVKSPERVAIESLIFSVTSNHVLYINNVSPFFLFISSSAAFRQLFRRVIDQCMRHLPIIAAPTVKYHESRKATESASSISQPTTLVCLSFTIIFSVFKKCLSRRENPILSLDFIGWLQKLIKIKTLFTSIFAVGSFFRFLSITSINIHASYFWIRP